jgi:hypothetical protein
MLEISTYALEAAIEAVDEKIKALHAQIAQNDKSNGNTLQTSALQADALQAELRKFTRAAASLRESHEEAVWEAQSITPYNKLALFYQPDATPLTDLALRQSDSVTKDAGRQAQH